MIKFVNDGEIDKLKKGFHKTLALKIINMFDTEKFMNLELDLDKAIIVYKLIAQLNFPVRYSGSNNVMMNYFVKYNVFAESELEEINEIFRDDCSEDKEDDDENLYEYGDFYEERDNYISHLLEEVGALKGIKIHTETFSNIAALNDDDIDLKVFGEIRETLMSYLSNPEEAATFTEEDWYNQYSNSMQDEATLYVLEDYEINEKDIWLLSNTLNADDYGVTSDIYTCKGNTYICLSGTQLYQGIDYSFLIILKLILMSIN